MYGILLLFPLNLIQAQGYPATMAGMTQLPLMGMLMAFSPIAGTLVDRFGPRLPITLGSLVTGAGYFVLGIPELTDGPRSFWTAYLPALLLIGAGMGLVLTPLSATVMNAVSAKHAGIASGINSAVSRVASVLGIAVLGSLAILSYRSTVDRELPPLSAQVRETLLRSTERLGDTRIPVEVDAADRPAVAQTLRTSFARVFRRTAWLVAGLAGLGALVSFVLMKGAAGGNGGGAT
jgi:MFS family permease